MFLTESQTTGLGDFMTTLILGAVVIAIFLTVTSSRSGYNIENNDHRRYPFLYCRQTSIGLSSSVISSLLFPYRTLLSSYFENGNKNNFVGDNNNTDNQTAIQKNLLTRDHIEMIVQRDWKTLMSFIAFHPNQVSKLRDSKQQTILHHACLFRAPVHVIEGILSAAPELASIQNADGELALHWAIRLAIPNLSLVLMLHAYPQSPFIKDNNDVSPLSLLWDRHQRRLIELWNKAEHNEEGGREPPLSLLDSETLANEISWKRILTVFRIAYKSHYFLEVTESSTSGIANNTDLRRQQQEDIVRRIGLAEIKTPISSSSPSASFHINDENQSHHDVQRQLQDDRNRRTNHKILSSYTSSCSYCGDNNDTEFSPLHAAASQSGLPSSLFPFMIYLYRDQLSKRDGPFGRTPLAVAAASGSGSDSTSFSFGIFSRASGNADANANSITMSTTKIQLLIQKYPSAVQMVDNQGRYPLHLAALSGIGWETGIEQLFNSYPQALGIRDPETSLFPFQLGAIKASKTEHEVSPWSAVDSDSGPLIQLTVAYRLLRADPSLLLAKQSTTMQ